MITAIIPAKGTSQRVPQKNTQFVGNETLVDRAISFAKRIPEINQIIVSTDSIELVAASTHLSLLASKFEEISQNETIELSPNFILHKRGEVDAQQDTKTIEVIKSIYQSFDEINEDVLLLQPTSPFRFKSEFDDLLRLYRESGSDVFSAKKIESPHPLKCFEINESQNPILTPTLIENLAKPAQQMPSFYAPDGAFYLNSLKSLLASEKFVTPNSRIFIREPKFTVNIDTPEDLEFARVLEAMLDVGYF
jgi:CMP-N-acetylneuraminic acid synthetase